jgi:hypothetical protein
MGGTDTAWGIYRTAVVDAAFALLKAAEEARTVEGYGEEYHLLLAASAGLLDDANEVLKRRQESITL